MSPLPVSLVELAHAYVAVLVPVRGLDHVLDVVGRDADAVKQPSYDSVLESHFITPW